MGQYLVSIGLLFFAFTTILGWNYYGRRCTEYLFGVKAIKPYRLIYLVLVASGAFLHLDLIWLLADIVNGLMAVPNLISLIGLRRGDCRDPRLLQPGPGYGVRARAADGLMRSRPAGVLSPGPCPWCQPGSGLGLRQNPGLDPGSSDNICAKYAKADAHRGFCILRNEWRRLLPQGSGEEYLR